jgi:hypothetical protein
MEYIKVRQLTALHISETQNLNTKTDIALKWTVF